jgi:hypothetical protein
LKNPHLPISLKKLKDGETYSKCHEKTGYIYLANNVFSSNNLPLQIKVVPIFAILTRRTISFMMGPQEKSMFNQIKLENIQKITQRYTNSFCFDIVENNVIENSLAKGPISLCAKNTHHMQNWITAIQEFKECSINIVSMDNMQNKVLIDFEKVNELLKPRSNLQKQKEYNPLYYDGDGNGEHPYIKKDETEISKVLKTIVNTIEGANINERQISRTMYSKIQRAEKFAFDVKRKTDLLDSMIQKRQMREKDKEAKLIQYESKARELRLLKAVLGRIKQYKVN